MLKLEMLYNCARDNLEGEPKDWAGFTDGFHKLMEAEFALYVVANDENGWVEDTLTLLATNKPDIVEAYMNGGFHRQNQIKEAELQSLEPSRRTDMLSDEEFLNIATVNDFYVKHGLFFMMIVPAILQDGRFASLMVWRDRDENDFDDMEKMRLGLFMRYLIKVIAPQNLLHEEASSEMMLFGKTYGLTNAEIDVLSYLLEGYSLRKIASETDRSYGTVRWHIRNILEKCQVPDQKNLVRQFYALVKS
ncbi:helix-turn-helix transcriptional regulator [Roseibium sp. MMSF_3412]|uniref:helix-turn-helix transcriptional regulator n=1 Tax=Roseibium sp. MMSF_3412 TaxID=3046712 RepID=UPI00273EB496|nr:helix-turn-helix transcriptional regulator [Roseibium sp. MMSF_3412]